MDRRIDSYVCFKSTVMVIVFRCCLRRGLEKNLVRTGGELECHCADIETVIESILVLRLFKQSEVQYVHVKFLVRKE